MAQTQLEASIVRSARSISLTESYAFCKRLAKRTAGNFYYSFLTLPRRQFREMCALYGFMRICDDIADDPSKSHIAKSERLNRWRDELNLAWEGDCSGHAVFPALMDVARRREIPPEYFHAVINGVETDLQPREFSTFEDLNGYCYQVAGVVGLCCIHIWGQTEERAASLAIDCGTAFQLTNILRDLGDDVALGRVYLPQDELALFNYTRDDIAAQRRDDRFLELMRFQVDRARTYFERSQELFGMLKPPYRAIYSAMRKIYGGVLHEIERRDFDVFTRRISLSRWRKLRHTFGSVVKHRLLRR